MASKYLFMWAMLLLISPPSVSQKLYDRAGQVTFFSDAPIEDIKAVNKQAQAVLDTSSGRVAVSMQMNAFEFRKKLMQEHFNENYVESDKYPKATLSGEILNYDSTTLKNAKEVMVKGNLTIHGVTQEREITVRLTPGVDNVIRVQSVFNIEIAEFNIKIPTIVIKNIAEVVEVTVDLTLKPD